jgi:3-hydroxyisobutyrate dehydrogenase-like beta-hydroxyacid dehydrogenase
VIIPITKGLQMKIGFIGLGSMGAPIARRLARCGFDVIGCDVVPEMLQAFDEPGTTWSSDPIETARLADQLGICVRTDEQLANLVDGGRLFEALGQGGLVILHSTVSPNLARELAAQAKKYDVGFVDVGVSGGAPAAIEGKLALFVGGEDAEVERAKPWLEAIGKSMAFLGPVGRGQEGKLLNNLISIANYGMSAAIVDVATALGFDRDKFIDVLMSGSAQSYALKVAPNFVRKRSGMGSTSSFMGLHDLLQKDVEHCRELPPADPVAMQALLASCEAMLTRLRRAAAEAEPAAPGARVSTD